MKTKTLVIITTALICAAPIGLAARHKKHHHRHHHHAVAAKPAAVTPPPPPLPQVLPQMLITLTHSSQFGDNLSARWVNYLTQNLQNAFGFEVGYGNGEFRLSGTLAHQFNDNNRIKITAEHYAQQPEFDFVLVNHQQWVGQNAGGAIYEHLFSNANLLKNIFFGGYYSHAESETFKEPTFTTAEGTFIDVERFAGASSEDAQAGFTLQPWAWTRAAFTLYYDNTNFDTQYEPDNDVSGVGGGVALQQLLAPNWKIAAFGSARQPFDQVGGGIYWLANTRPGRRLEVGLSDQYITGNDIYANPDNRLMLSLNYSWGGDPCAPRTNYTDEDSDNLINWTMDAAVRMPAVLVQRDGAVIKQ